MSQQAADPREFRSGSRVMLHLVLATLLVFSGVVLLLLPVAAPGAPAMWSRVGFGSAMLLVGAMRFLKVMQD